MFSAPDRSSRQLFLIALAVFIFAGYMQGNTAQDQSPHTNTVSSILGPPSILKSPLVAQVSASGDKKKESSPRRNGLVPASQFNSEVAVSWFKLQLKLTKETHGFSPPVASRAFGYAGVTLYEAIVPGMPTHQSLAGQLNDLTLGLPYERDEEYHWPAVANSALASILKRLFAHASAQNLAAIDHLETQYNEQFESKLQPEVFNRSIFWGKRVAESIYAWSRTDGGHEGYAKNFPPSYILPSSQGLWTPTPPVFSRALQPYWGKNRPFVLNSGAECAPPAHPAYSEQSESAFYKEAMEVYTTARDLTTEQRAIAEFWADNPTQTSTPPGHSISILNQILIQKNATLDIAAEAYAKVGMAVADAFIACWFTKYQYNLLRPITYIHKVIDPNWKPLVITPPFPEYPSGHSVQSAATAQVMTDVFGTMAFDDHTHDNRKIAPRSFSSFFEAANEAAISRLYGGIHYRAAIELGFIQGKDIGRRVSALQFKKSAFSSRPSVISKNSAINSRPQATSNQQPATNIQQQATSKPSAHFTAAFQIDLSQKSATVKPLTGVLAKREFVQLGVPVEATAVTERIRLRPGNVQFDLLNGIFSFDATLTNISSTIIFTPLRVVIQNLRPGSTTVLNADGGGNRNGAFYSYTESVGLDKLLAPNEISTTRKWQFFTPEARPFSFTVLVEGELQRITAPPAPIITPPASPTTQLSIPISGTADPNARIEIATGAGVAATTTANVSGAFTATVSLEVNHNNRFFVTALNSFGRSTSTLVEVIHDTQPPALFIDVPADSAEVSTSTTAIAGRVGDMLSGFKGLRVTVNEQSANVVGGIGTNGTFERQGVSLTLGANTITATATDEAGNNITKRITVMRVDLTGQPQMAIVSGNGQTAQINSSLPQPLVVRVTKGNGTPFPNKIVTFEIARSDGRLAAAVPVGNGAMKVQVLTNVNGLATAYWKLGSDTGFGNNRVSVSSLNIAGATSFCASATPAPATRINVGTGDNQRAEVGGPAPEALQVWVNDGLNGVANTPVTFKVVEGGGKVNGADSVTINTATTGYTQVRFDLGPQPGNNFVEANFPGNPGVAVTFSIFGVARTNQPTSFTGLVLDNSNQPIQGATCNLTVSGVLLPATVSDVNGRFSFTNISTAGPAHLYVNGLDATAVNGQPVPPGNFPALAYDLVIIPNAENSLPAPVLLPPLNPNNARVYDGTQDVELTVEGIDGLKMIVKAGSMRRVDGSVPSVSDPVVISLNQVHFDKIPMPMPDGVGPNYAGTLQPMGATFDPPVQVTFPNVFGLPPGTISSFLSFNHATNRFEIVATGYITADGSAFVTDPGSGISIAGWHGPRRPALGGGGNAEAGSEPGNKNPPPAAPNEAATCPIDDAGMDPVYLFSGEFYEEVEDLRIQGRGMDFVWSRKYRSKTGIKTVQGNGWDFSYNLFVKPEGDGIRLGDGNTRNDLYLPKEDTTWARGEFFRDLAKNADQTYKLSFAGKDNWNFNPYDGRPAEGKVTSIADRNGNQMSFYYDANGRLIRVTDTLGRDILVGYNANGFIETITDFIGRVVRYEYYNGTEPGGSFGDLKSVTTPAVTGTPNGNDFPSGKKTTYTYSTGFSDDRLNHNLLTITDGRRNNPSDPTFGQGPYLINIFAGTTNTNDLNFDRVVRQIWGGDTVDVTYVRQRPSTANGKAVLKVILNDRVGNVKEYFYDLRNRGVLSREYTGRANPRLPTTETTNRPRGKLRPTDPDFFETRYEYNFDALPTRIIHPNGNLTEMVYEADLDPNAPPRKRGNRRMLRHLPGAHTPVGDQTVIEESFEYDSDFNACCGFNFVTRHVDGRGNATSFQYDGRGNRTRIQHRLPTIVENFEYNQFGQMTAHVHPDNGSSHRRRDIYSYYDSGPARGYLRQEIIDAPNLALTTTYEYDRVGNVIRRIDPRSHDTQYVVNQLDQVVREISREVKDGSGVRYQKGTLYDANNNVIQRNIQNIDDQGVVQPNNLFTTTYEYEILNHLVRMTEEVDATTNIVTEYAYDNNRNRTLMRFGEATAGRQLRNVAAMFSDERDLLFKQIRAAGDPQQSTTQYDYDRNRNLIAKRVGLESAPRVLTYLYDAYNRRISQTDPLGNVTTNNYDANGNAIRTRVAGELIDVPGSAANVRLSDLAYAYDAMDRRTRTETEFFDTASQAPIDDGKAMTQTFYNDNSQIVRVVDDNNHTALTSYDTANRQKVITDDKNNTTTFAYDANSNVTTITQVEKSDLGGPDETFVTTNVYDNLDRLNKTTDNAGNINEFGYDSRGNRTLMLDALRTAPNNPGNKTTFVYDGLNRLVRTTRFLTSNGNGSGTAAGTIVTTQGWDHSSRLVSQTDNNGNVTSYTYDPLNRRTAITYADGTAQRYTYDVHDNRLTTTDANGNAVASTYDLGNRLIINTITRGSGIGGTTSENYQYDGLSRLVLARDDDAEMTRSYNSLSAVTRETLNGRTTTSIYDGVGNLRSCTYPGGRMINTTYDELERKKAISDQHGQIAEYKYIGASRVARRDYANNTRTTFQYDNVKRMTRTTHTRDPLGTPAIIDDRTYTWDQMYNKTSRRDMRTGGLNYAYTYDSIYRLIRSVKTPASGTPETITYSLDGVGNRTSVAGGAQPGNYTMDPASPEPADRQLNQYTTTSFDRRLYDKNGDLLRINDGMPSQRNFIYDYRNQMIEHRDIATGVNTTYAYDALGRRTQKAVTNGSTTETTRYFYDGWQVIEERNAATGTTQATYVYGLYIDEVLNMQRDVDNNGAAEDYFYHADQLYNVMAVTNVSGAVVERYDYGDYGEPRFLDASGNAIAAGRSLVENPYLVTGRHYDSESRFYYYRTRYLDANSGRFLQRDVIGIWGDSHNLGNGYTYVANNPITMTDPEGRWIYDLIEYIPFIGDFYVAGQNAVQEFINDECEEGTYGIPDNVADAFGHCWYACMATRISDRATAAHIGGRYEEYRESWISGPHNSYSQDRNNQGFGRNLAEDRPDDSCASSCASFARWEILDLSAPTTAVYCCPTRRWRQVVPCIKEGVPFPCE